MPNGIRKTPSKCLLTCLWKGGHTSQLLLSPLSLPAQQLSPAFFQLRQNPTSPANPQVSSWQGASQLPAHRSPRMVVRASAPPLHPHLLLLASAGALLEQHCLPTTGTGGTGGLAASSLLCSLLCSRHLSCSIRINRSSAAPLQTEPGPALCLPKWEPVLLVGFKMI